MRKADREELERKAREERRREERRREAARLWGELDERTRQRTALLIAAFILDAGGETQLADMLLLARPEHARDVAAGVAAHALRRGIPAAWDALMATDTADMDLAVRLYDQDSDLVWGPAHGALVGEE